MAVAERFTSADLALMPDDNKRYEIIDGELYVSKSPGYEHQYTCGRFIQLLSTWNDEANLGVVLLRRASSLPRIMTLCPTLCGSAASA